MNRGQKSASYPKQRGKLVLAITLLSALLVGAVFDFHSAQSDALCPPLPAPTGDVVHVSTVAELQNAVSNLTPNTTILLADGTYDLHGAFLWLGVPGVTMRSASGNREAVVIDGNYETTEIVVVAASDVTIADLTLKRAMYHPIHVIATDDADIENTLIYNVHVMDPGQQAIKINQNSAMTHFPDYGVIACSHVELTDEGRPRVWEINDSCYTGGVDGHQARGWVIRDNVIEGFWCEHDLAEHGIHFWTGSRDTVVERNTLIDNARGVGLGLGQSGNQRVYDDNPCPGADYVGHFGGVIRNNFVFASRGALFSSESSFDCGICLEQACGTQVLHNTVASTGALFSSIEWRWPNTNVEITNNLVSHNLRERDGAIASLAGNLENAPLSLFVDGAGGNLHLAASASAAIDQGVALAAGLCDDDVDGGSRPMGPAPDVGADEYGALPPAITEPTASPTATSAPPTPTPTTEEPAVETPVAEEPAPPARPPTEPDLVDDFEGTYGPYEGWEVWSDIQAGDSMAVTLDNEVAHGGSTSLRIEFDIAPGSWADFGRSFDPARDWSDGMGLSMWLRFSESTGGDQGMNVILGSGEPENSTPFETWFEISPESADPSGWILVELPWDHFTKPDWASEGDLSELDPSRVTGIALSFGAPDDSRAESTVWIDDIRLLGEAPQPAPTEAAPAAPATPTTAPVAAATATEAVVAAATATEAPTPPPPPTSPAEEEDEGGGLCPVSVGLALTGLMLARRGKTKPE